MVNSKISMQKIFAYFFIGFISFLLIIFFVGSDIISSFGGTSIDPNVLAVVNNQKIYTIDFIRYRDRFNDPNLQGKESFLLDSLIANILFYQRAKKLGIDVTDAKVAKQIQAYFKDKNSGVFDKEMFKEFLQKTHSTVSDFYRTTYKDVITDEFRKLIMMGFTVTPDDVLTEYRFYSAQCQIRYAFISMEDISKSLLSKITINEIELQSEMTKNKSKYPDEITNKRLTKEALTEAKLDKALRSLAEKINTMAKKGEPFTNAAAELGGSVGTTPVFTLGEPVKKDEKEDSVLAGISKSLFFYEDCIFTPPQKTSRIVITPDGLCVFTPLQVKLIDGNPGQAEYNKIVDKLTNQSFEMAFNKLIEIIREDAKIKKYLKTN